MDDLARAGIEPIAFAGHDCLRFTTPHGTAIVALQGAQVLSWRPSGQRDIFWLTPNTLAPPAAIRGGVPICWPWFGTQGMPIAAMAHGPVRNRLWEVRDIQIDDPERIGVTWVPRRAHTDDDPLQRLAPDLQLSLHMEFGDTLMLTLHTCNQGRHAFAVTQAFHNYFAVHDATQVSVGGLTGLRYRDMLHHAVDHLQQGEFVFKQACDRIYHNVPGHSLLHYTLDDRGWGRRIHLTTEGSQSVVVWNPGANPARPAADLPDGAWRNFLCVEATNAGADVVMLAPGAEHRLRQTIALENGAA